MAAESGKKPTTVRLSAEAQRLLAELSDESGISKTAILELAIREMAARKQKEKQGN